MIRMSLKCFERQSHSQYWMWVELLPIDGSRGPRATIRVNNVIKHPITKANLHFGLINYLHLLVDFYNFFLSKSIYWLQFLYFRWNAEKHFNVNFYFHDYLLEWMNGLDFWLLIIFLFHDHNIERNWWTTNMVCLLKWIIRLRYYTKWKKLLFDKLRVN